MELLLVYLKAFLVFAISIGAYGSLLYLTRARGKSTVKPLGVFIIGPAIIAGAVYVSRYLMKASPEFTTYSSLAVMAIAGFITFVAIEIAGFAKFSGGYLEAGFSGAVVAPLATWATNMLIPGTGPAKTERIKASVRMPIPDRGDRLDGIR